MFTPKTLSFLRALKRNNNKDWFHAHREDYDNYIVAPNHALIAELSKELRKIYPEITVTNRSISRINRDTRFSSNKDPYKTWVGFSFRDQTIPDEAGPGLYFGYDMTGFLFGCGKWEFVKGQREHFRSQIMDSKRGPEFTKIMSTLKKAKFDFSEPSLKKVPKEFNVEHPNAVFTMYNGLTVSREFDPMKKFYSADFAKFVVKEFTPYRAFFMWMRDMAKSAPKDQRRFLSIDRSRPMRDARDEF